MGWLTNMQQFARSRYRNHFLFLSCAVAFLIPVVPRMVPLGIVLLTINWLIGSNFRLSFREFKTNHRKKYLVLFSVFYLIYVAGLAYSANMGYAFFDLEVKLSLLIFPLIFAFSPWPLYGEDEWKKILKAFVAGCLTGALLLLVHANVEYSMEPDYHAFLYSRLSWYIHPSYLSMYYNLAIIIIYAHVASGNKGLLTRMNLFYLFSALFFMWMTLLLNSKAGLITLVLLWPGLPIWWWLTNVWRRMVPMFLLTIVMFLITGSFLAPLIFDRFAEIDTMMEKDNKERVETNSTGDRLVAWSASAELIRENPWFGVGTGDVKDALVEKYRVNNAIPALKNRLNAHNQYLQTAVTLGMPGVAVLVLMLVMPAIYAIRNKMWIYLFFLVIFSLNLMVESMLEVQAGVVYYAFFNALFFASEKKGDWSPNPLAGQH